MKKNIFVFSLLFIELCVFAQTPDWQLATRAGGSDDDWSEIVAVDDQGNCYVTGSFEETATFGSYSLVSNGSSDIFIAKMDANGSWLWATGAGGSDDDEGVSIAIDDNGNIYITGKFYDAATFGSFSLTSNGDDDIFVAKMDSSGNWLWITGAGGSDSERSKSISLDSAENIYVTGSFYDTTTFGSHSLTSNGGSDVFVAKMDANGSWLWITGAGGSDSDYGLSIAIDNAENIYVTGDLWNTATFGSYSITNNGSSDIFVAKMDTDGNWLWATGVGGIDEDSSGSIAIDDNGNIIVVGSFIDTVTFGTTSIVSSGSFDIFVAKIDASGNWMWATGAGGSDSDFGYSIAVDDAEKIYVTGAFYNIATFGSYSLTSNGEFDIFVAKIDENGNWLWATGAGGSDFDLGESIVIDHAENIFVTGEFSDNAIFGSYSLTSSGEFDVFVAKLVVETIAENEIIPTNLNLCNHPNPFNPSTTIEFYIQNDSIVELAIYNIKGQKIKTLADNEFAYGSHSIIWNGNDESNNPVSSGIYYYKLNVKGKTEAVKKCLLLK